MHPAHPCRCLSFTNASLVAFLSSQTPEAEYARLEAAGALAVIALSTISPPGFNAYRHDSWSTEKWRDHRMPFVACSFRIEDERTWGHAELKLSITDPSVKPFQDFYTSWLYTVCFRGLPALFASFTSYIAVKEAMRIRGKWGVLEEEEKTSVQNLVYLICIIEAPSVLIVGAVVGFGQFGPETLPSTVHLLFSDVLMGIGTATTLFLALHLREELRHLSEHGEKLSIWKKHGFPLRFMTGILFLISFMPLRSWLIGTVLASEW